MVLRLCQLKSLLFLSLIAVSSCSFFRSNKDQASELLTPMKNEWFSSNPNHSLQDLQGKPQTHHFFDVNPELSKKDIYVNSVVIIPEGSDHSYQLDLASGQRYYSHSYCAQDDIWSEYSGSISKPTFSIGVIPRLLDQLGEPQKVIIFGGAKKFAERTDFHEHRIRLIGAVIEQACPGGNCLGRNNWVSKMVFVAIDYEDKRYKNINDIEELQKKVDWVKTKAVLENLDGRNSGGEISYPAVRIGKLIKLDEAMEYYKKRSIYLSKTESQKIRQGCHALYDKLWSEVGIEQPEDKPVKTIEALNIKVKLMEELKKKRKPVGFSARMKAFTEKYFNEFTTCQKFVYAGNINQNPEAFWFLNYAGMFLRLHKDGYFFDCRNQSWQKNTLNNVGKPVYDINNGLEYCKDRDYDRAMENMPHFLAGIKGTETSYYKFVDYDTHTFGTHQKLYSWVKLKTKKYDCGFDPNPGIKKELKAFPEDVTWKTRYIKDIADELKIIY
jgi:hypothetical protein